jgi:hypothetical protein
MGGDPLAQGRLAPVDDLDAVFERHDQAYTLAKTNQDVERADKEMLRDMGKLLANPAWTARHPDAVAYMAAAIPAFTGKLLLSKLGFRGLSSVEFNEGAESQPQLGSYKEQMREKPMESFKQRLIMEHIAEALAPIVQSQYDYLPVRQRRRNKEALPRAIAEMLRGVLLRAGDIEVNPGPGIVLRDRAAYAEGRKVREIRVLSRGTLINWCANLESPLTEAEYAAGLRRLMLSGDIEENPGPMNPADAMKKMDDAVEEAAKVISTQNMRIEDLISVEQETGRIFDVVYAGLSSADTNVYYNAVSPVSCTADRHLYWLSAGPSPDENVDVPRIFFNYTVPEAPMTRRCFANPGIASLIRGATSANVDPTTIQQLMAAARTNWYRFDGSTISEFFGSFLPNIQQDGSALSGSAASQIAILLAWMTCQAHIDVNAGQRNMFWVSPTAPIWDPLQARPYAAGTVTAAGAGTFPFTYGYALESDRILATAVSFGTFMSMQNANQHNTSAFARANWQNPNFLIVPLATGMALSNPGYITMLTIARMHHPFVIPTAKYNAVDGTGVAYRTGSGPPVTVQEYVSNSAFHSVIGGPAPIDNNPSIPGGQLFVLYVLVDIAAQNGGSQSVTISVGTDGALGTDYTDLSTTAAPGAGTAIGDFMYKHLQVGGQYVVQTARQALGDTLRFYASQNCVEAAVGWLVGITPVVKHPVLRGNITLEKTSGLYTVAANGVSSYAAPIFATTNMAIVDSAAEANELGGLQTTPFGNSWSAAFGAIDTVLLGTPAEIHARLPQSNVYADLALLARWFIADPRQAVLWENLPFVTSMKLRWLQYHVGSMVASAVDYAMEIAGLPADSWWSHSNTGVGQSIYPILSAVLPYFGQPWGVDTLLADYNFTPPQMQLQVNNYLPPVRRIPAYYCQKEDAPVDANLPLGSKTPSNILVLGAPGNLALDFGQDLNGMGVAAPEWFNKLRAYQLTGTSSQANSQLIKCTSWDGAYNVPIVVAWLPQYLGTVADNVWANVFKFTHARSIPSNYDQPVAGIVPYVNPYASGQAGRTRINLLYVSSTRNGDIQSGGVVVVPYMIPQPPGAMALPSTYSYKGGYDPLGAASWMTAGMGGMDSKAEEVKTFQGSGTKPVAGDEGEAGANEA